MSNVLDFFLKKRRVYFIRGNSSINKELADSKSLLMF